MTRMFLDLKERIIPEWLFDEIVALNRLGWALAVNSFLISFIPATIAFFAGHLGNVLLAAVGLGQSFCNITLLPIGLGFASACDTLCSQAYGAGNYKKISLVVQRAFLIIIIIGLPIIALWINSEKVLLAFGQKPEVARLAAQYIEFNIAGFIMHIMLNIVIRYLACQKIVLPLVYAAILGTAVNLICCYLFMFHFKYGIRGGVMALVLAYFSILSFLLFFVYFTFSDSESLQGCSWEVFRGWKEVICLGTSNTAMMIVEQINFQLGIITLGMLGATEQATQLVLYTINNIVYYISLGIATAAAVRVGNLLGAGKPIQAKRAMKAAIFFEVGITGIAGISIFASKNVIGQLFTNDRSVLHEASRGIPLICISPMVDGLTAVLLGIVRGSGSQKFGTVIIFIGNICVSMPLVPIFIFFGKMSVLGAWTAMITGWTFQVVCLTALLLKSDWNKLSEKAQEMHGILHESTAPCYSSQPENDDAEQPKNKCVTYNNGVVVKDDLEEKSQLLKEKTRESTDFPNSSSNDTEKLKSTLIVQKLAIAMISMSILIMGVFIRIYL